jgi:hypothetical protein
MIAFIDEHRDAYGVEPICRVLPIAPSSYHERVAQRRDPGRRSARPAVFPQGQFLGQQSVDGFDPIDLTLLDAAQRGVEHFQRTRHLQVNQAATDVIDALGGCRERHGRSPLASCAPIIW